MDTMDLLNHLHINVKGHSEKQNKFPFFPKDGGFE
jgi:hypothetical protein